LFHPAKSIGDIKIAPLWDTVHRADINRMQEHENMFYLDKKVLIICPIYKSFPQIVSSMITQTYQNWEMFLVHDGPAEQWLINYINYIKDDRIKFIQTQKRSGDWGHSIRQTYVKHCENIEGDYLLITNGDNYHTPNALEVMVKGFELDIVATYCESMAHSHIDWKVIQCRPERGYMDCAGVMVKKDAACQVGWMDATSHSADWIYFQDIGNKFGWDKFKKVEGCLLIHN